MSATAPTSPTPRVTAPSLRTMKEAGRPIVMLTAYDYHGARLVEAAGVDAVLVGDSLGMTVLGHTSTLPVTMDDMVRATAAVSRACTKALVIADMPFMTYAADYAEGMRNAGRLVAEGGAHAVKVEGASAATLDLVAGLTEAGIPVMGHVGLTPQSVNTLGGYRTQGKDAAQRRRSPSPMRSRSRRPARSRSCSSASPPSSPSASPRCSRFRRSASAPASAATARCRSSTTCSAWASSCRSTRSATRTLAKRSRRRSPPTPTTCATGRFPARSSRRTWVTTSGADRCRHRGRDRCPRGRRLAARGAAAVIERVSSKAEVRSAVATRAARARRSASCRRWARCTTGTCRSCAPRASAPTSSSRSIFVNPTQFAPGEDFDALSAPTRDRHRTARRGRRRASCSRRASSEMYAETRRSPSTPGRWRPVGGRGPARALRRGGDRRHEAAQRGPPRARVLRREGLPAARDRASPGRRPRPRRRASSGARSCATPTASRSRAATRTSRPRSARRRSRCPPRSGPPQARSCWASAMRVPRDRDARGRRRYRRRRGRARLRCGRRPETLEPLERVEHSARAIIAGRVGTTRLHRQLRAHAAQNG